ncbi:MAG: hypothetical protein KF796_10205 [Ramlibacter sp.]|nr:hypothetical protein [Ramlibacter sp.]
MSDRDRLPALAIPVLRTARLARTQRLYQEALGFTLAQEVPGVVALLRHGPLCLQLWQHGQLPQPDCCRIPLDGPDLDIFQCHARLAASARAWIDDAPRLKPWGAWEFCLLDAEGNRLVFVQWALGRLVLAEDRLTPPGGMPAPGHRAPRIP